MGAVSFSMSDCRSAENWNPLLTNPAGQEAATACAGSAYRLAGPPYRFWMLPSATIWAR